MHLEDLLLAKEAGEGLRFNIDTEEIEMAPTRRHLAIA